MNNINELEERVMKKNATELRRVAKRLGELARYSRSRTRTQIKNEVKGSLNDLFWVSDNLETLSQVLATPLRNSDKNKQWAEHNQNYERTDGYPREKCTPDNPLHKRHSFCKH